MTATTPGVTVISGVPGIRATRTPATTSNDGAGTSMRRAKVATIVASTTRSNTDSTERTEPPGNVEPLPTRLPGAPSAEPTSPTVLCGRFLACGQFEPGRGQRPVHDVQRLEELLLRHGQVPPERGDGVAEAGEARLCGVHTGRCELDQAGPAVVRVLGPLEVTVRGHPAQVVRHRAGSHAEVGGEPRRGGLAGQPQQAVDRELVR